MLHSRPFFSTFGALSRRSLRMPVLWALMLCLGCIEDVQLGVHDAGPDGSIVALGARDASPMVSLCEGVVCNPGDVCCDECGICQPDAFGCGNMICPPINRRDDSDAGPRSDASGDFGCEAGCQEGEHCCPACDGLSFCFANSIPCPPMNCGER